MGRRQFSREFKLEAAGERALAELAADAQRASELLLQELQGRLSLLEAGDASGT